MYVYMTIPVFFKYMGGKLIEGFELNYYPIKLLYSYIYDSTNHAQSAKPGFLRLMQKVFFNVSFDHAILS